MPGRRWTVAVLLALVGGQLAGLSLVGPDDAAAVAAAARLASQPVVTGVEPGRGPATGGSVMTVRGTGFTGAIAVTFGGVPGTGLVVHSDTELTVTTPPHRRALVHAQVVGPDRTSSVSWATYVAFQDDPRIQVAPLPADARLVPRVHLGAVDCGAPGSCVAVGSYEASSGGDRHLVEVLGRDRWRTDSLPAPFGTTDLRVMDVACPGPATCFVVGAAGDPTSRATLWRRDGTVWSVASSLRRTGTVLTGVDCFSATSCVAWGDSCRADGCVPLVLTLDGGTWRISPVVVPPELDGLRLDDVDCWSQTECVGIGESTDDDSDDTDPFVFRRGPGAWSVQPPVEPADADRHSWTFLQALSCVPELCYVVGQYESGADRSPFLSTITPTGETAVRVRGPRQAGADAAVFVRDLDCVEAGWCQGVGYFRVDGGDDRAVSVQVADGVARMRAVPTAGLEAVECAAEGRCAALSGARTATVQGTTVTAVPAPLAALPEGPRWFYSLDALAADSTSSAVAVGVAYRGTSQQVGLLMTGVPIP